MMVSKTYVQAGMQQSDPTQPSPTNPLPKMMEAMQVDLVWMKHKITQLDQRVRELEAAMGLEEKREEKNVE